MYMTGTTTNSCYICGVLALITLFPLAYVEVLISLWSCVQNGAQTILHEPFKPVTETVHIIWVDRAVDRAERFSEFSSTTSCRWF